MTAKRKRPKVRYVADMVLNVERTLPGMVCDRNGRVVAHYCTWAYAKRIAAALNMYEATKRREI